MWSSRSKAETIVSDSFGNNNGSKALIDFTGVEEISPSFANQLLRELIKKTEIGKIKFVGEAEVVSKALSKQKKY